MAELEAFWKREIPLIKMEIRTANRGRSNSDNDIIAFFNFSEGVEGLVDPGFVYGAKSVQTERNDARINC